MFEELFTFLYNLMTGSVWWAIIASFTWGLLSILLSPCHLSSIPLVVGYMLSINFRRSDQVNNANLSLILGILVLIIVLIFSFIIPALDNIPDILFNIVYVFGARTIFLRYQKKEVILHIQNGGQVYNWWVVAGLIFLGMLLVFGVLLIFFLIEDGSYKFFL